MYIVEKKLRYGVHCTRFVKSAFIVIIIIVVLCSNNSSSFSLDRVANRTRPFRKLM